MELVFCIYDFHLEPMIWTNYLRGFENGVHKRSLNEYRRIEFRRELIIDFRLIFVAPKKLITILNIVCPFASLNRSPHFCDGNNMSHSFTTFWKSPSPVPTLFSFIHPLLVYFLSPLTTSLRCVWIKNLVRKK